MIEKEGIVIKNKYEDIEMIELEEREDICDIFIDNAADIDNTDVTVAVIANKELVSYITEELLKHDWTSAQKIDFDEDNVEYMVSVNGGGYVVAIPITRYDNKYFTDIDVVYISMDSDVNQDIIDKCLDMDKDVALFGLEDEDCECDCCGKCDCNGSVTTKSNSSTVSKDDDGTLNGFSVSWADSNDGAFYSSSYSYYSNDENTVRRLAKEFGVNVD